ncbi:hypothetical protein JKP88DRAFT_247310 [Tribonema minus]|uniref:Uncharacterized protein n=1 Tax=Tribonema minus TaxID=303371 RepID=A0A835YQ53_9STRA|nr:hypothetical protein JKP88DRAFT_247310 [Tribonema minus]
MPSIHHTRKRDRATITNEQAEASTEAIVDSGAATEITESARQHTDTSIRAKPALHRRLGSSISTAKIVSTQGTMAAKASKLMQMSMFSRPEPARQMQELASRQLASATNKQCTPISYEAQFNMFICPTQAGVANSNVKAVTESHVRDAVLSLDAFGKPSLDAVSVGFTTYRAPYKCAIAGSTQWSVSVVYRDPSYYRRHLTAVATTATNTTLSAGYVDPSSNAVTRASEANDWVTYSFPNNSTADFRTAFYAAVAAAAGLPAGAITYSDLQVQSSGWIARFSSSEGSVPPGSLAFSTPTMMSVGIAGNEVWPAWAWVLFALAVLACALPLCMFILKKRAAEFEEEEEGYGLLKLRKEEGLEKIHGNEFGITNLDFDGNYNDYEEPKMQDEYAGATAAAASRASHGHKRMDSAGTSTVDVSATAWSNEKGKKSNFAVAGQVAAFDIVDTKGSIDFDHLRNSINGAKYNFD